MKVNGSEAGSCLRFMESMKNKMEEFMKTADIVDKRPRLTDQQIKKIMPQVIKKINAGENISQISKQLNIPRVTIYKRLKKNECITNQKTKKKSTTKRISQ